MDLGLFSLDLSCPRKVIEIGGPANGKSHSSVCALLLHSMFHPPVNEKIFFIVAYV
jgi:hypothetical protein